MRHEIPLRCRRSALAAVCLLGLWAGAQAADAWPARPLTLVVPFPAGGTTDLTGRALARALARLWGQPVVVENRAGAGGTVGASVVMRAAPDGYTLLLGTPADQVNAPLLMSRAPYDPAQAFAPAGCISRGPNVLVVNAKVPVRSVDELIRLAKAQPGKLHFASAGNGNTSHLSGELFSQTAGIDLAHVPYRGNSPAAIDVMGGQVEMMFSSPASVRPHIQSGALRVLAVTSDRRVPGFPDTPTLRESGLAIDIYSWSCLFVPAQTPAALVAKLNAALTQALGDREVEHTISLADAEKFPQTPQEARQFLARERKTWGDLIRTRNIRAD